MSYPIKPINLFEYEKLANSQLSQMAWDEVTLRDNRAAFERFKLRPRMLVDVSQRDIATKILGKSLAVPILIAPMAFQCLAHREGEIATASSAALLGIGMVLSTLATKSIEEVAAVRKQGENHPTQWFQLYIHRDRGLTRALVELAYANGVDALCLTVDAPMLGKREKNTRNQFTLPPGMSLANLAMLKDLEIPHKQGESGLFAYFAEQLDPGITWADLERKVGVFLEAGFKRLTPNFSRQWLQSLSPLPLAVKGILRSDDAVRAVEHGASSVIVSNHGGRQLDGAIASIDALSEVVAAVGEKAEVLVDGGIRRGTDILKALALGASAVLVGRPILWGLAVGGAAGVQHVIEILQDELGLAMALSGCAKLQDIDRSLLGALLLGARGAREDKGTITNYQLPTTNYQLFYI